MVCAAGLVAVAVGAIATARVLDRHPGAAARLSALAAGGTRRAAAAFGGDDADGAQPGRARRVACVPAVTVGAPGELRPLAGLAAGDRATAIFQWPAGRAGAGPERQAVRTLAAARGVTVAALGRGGAVVATADGPTLRALAARAPAAAVHLAVSGTRELCVVD